MKFLDYSHIDNFFVVGDIHGQFKTFFNQFKEHLDVSFQDSKHPKELEREAKKEEKKRLFNERTLELNRINNFNAEIQINDAIHEWRVQDFKTKLSSRSNRNYNNSIIIVAGDCGFGFNTMEYYLTTLTKYNQWLEMNNCHVLFMRGNHDDPEYFSEERINMSNIKTIQDYSVIKIKDKNILCVGGGLSVDRVWRQQQEGIINRFSKTNRKKLYWSGEMPNVNEEEIKIINNNNLMIDIVITHTAPSFVTPKNNDKGIVWHTTDTNLKDDLKIERETLDKLYRLLKENNHEVKLWFYGHFHTDMEEVYEKTFFKLCANNYRFHNVFKKLHEINMTKSCSKLTEEAYSALLSSKISTIDPIRWGDMLTHNRNLEAMGVNIIDDNGHVEPPIGALFHMDYNAHGDGDEAVDNGDETVDDGDEDFDYGDEAVDNENGVERHRGIFIGHNENLINYNDVIGNNPF